MSSPLDVDNQTVIPTIIGLSGGAIVLGLLWITGRIEGNSLSANIMLYAISGGTVALSSLVLRRINEWAHA